MKCRLLKEKSKVGKIAHRSIFIGNLMKKTFLTATLAWVCLIIACVIILTKIGLLSINFADEYLSMDLFYAFFFIGIFFFSLYIREIGKK